MKKITFTSAFTMLELIFVIIILGIVASIGSEVIVKVYEGYIIQRAEHRATLKTELAALQMTNRLTSAIPGTLFRIKDDNTTESVEVNMAGTGSGYKGLQWVSADMDSFSAASTPGWSGFCDLNPNNRKAVDSPGSDLTLATNIISKLSALASPASRTAIYFPNDYNTYTVSTFDTTNNIINLPGVGANHMSEHYKLAWTSYALVVEANRDGGQDLNLYYNFTPRPAKTAATTNSYGNGIKALLLHNISTFRFKVSGRTMQFKLCKQEAISSDVNITACKEKAVF